MTCEGCGAALVTKAPVAGLGICATCLRTVVVESGALAISTQTLALSNEQFAALVTLRKEARKERGLV